MLIQCLYVIMNSKIISMDLLNLCRCIIIIITFIINATIIIIISNTLRVIGALRIKSKTYLIRRGRSN